MFNANMSALDVSGLLGLLPDAAESGLDDVAGMALEVKGGEIQPTYQRPIPAGPQGAPKWRRSNDWKEGQVIESEPGERRILTTGAAAEYEGHLESLPSGEDGVNRSNPAAENALPKIEARASDTFEVRFAERMGL